VVSTGSALQTPMRVTLPGCAGTAVADLLAGTLRSGRIAGCGRYAAYVSLSCRPDVALAVCTSDAVRLPFGIHLGVPAASSPLAGLRVGDPVTVAERVVSAGTLEVTVARWRATRPAVGPVTDTDLASWANALQWARQQHGEAPGLGDRDAGVLRFAAALARRDASQALAATRGLIGRGPGSTPSGDDFVGSALAALCVLAPSHPAADALWAACGKALAVAVTATPETRTTAVSAALLRHAARGEPIGELADLLRCAGGAHGGQDAARAAAQRLLRIGHSSGADCLQGLAAVASALQAAEPPATAPQNARGTATAPQRRRPATAPQTAGPLPPPPKYRAALGADVERRGRLR
jgi:Protein of unknown function (DUF2877)